MLLMRRGSPAFRQLVELEAAGTLRWPDHPMALISRAVLRLERYPPQHAAGIRLLQDAVERDPALGQIAYPMLAQVWTALRTTTDATAYFRQQRERLQNPHFLLDEERRTRLIALLDRLLQRLP
jgi:hypothetical protein